jgi:hypothetical protein
MIPYVKVYFHFLKWIKTHKLTGLGLECRKYTINYSITVRALQ